MSLLFERPSRLLVQEYSARKSPSTLFVIGRLYSPTTLNDTGGAYGILFPVRSPSGELAKSVNFALRMPRPIWRNRLSVG